MFQKAILKKTPYEQYLFSFDYSKKDVLKKREVIKDVLVGAVDLTAISLDASQYFLDPSKQKKEGKQVFVFIRNGLVGHRYHVWCSIIGSQGTRRDNSVEFLIVKGK